MLDIGHFKMINDTWGHDFGDRALHEFAGACRRVIRKIDLFARYGGEEFVLLMPETAPEQGRAAAERLLETVAGLKLTTDTGHKVGMTVSIGLAETCLGFQGINQLIKQADSALYLAKKLGRNRVESYNGL